MLLEASETPEDRVSGKDVVVEGSLCAANVTILASPRSGTFTEGTDAGVVPAFTDSTETEVCFGFGAQVATTWFEISRSRTAVLSSSAVTDSSHWIPSNRRSGMSW